MTESIKKRAEECYDNGDVLVVCPPRMLFANGALFGASEVYRITEEQRAELKEKIAKAIYLASIPPLFPSRKGAHISPNQSADAALNALGFEVIPDG